MLKPVEICDEIIEVYSKKVKYPLLKSVILGILAGAFIAIGGFASSLASHSIDNVGVSKFVAGAVFPVGLILVLLCGTDLFTGNVLLVVPFADRKIKFDKIIKNWIIIYFSNFIGAVIIAYLIFYSGLLDTNGYKLGGYALKVAATKASITFSKALVSGIMCNIIVCLAVWISYAAKDVTGKIFAIWFPIMAFVVGGFEHSVANMYYFTIALFAKANGEYIQAYNLPAEKIAHINFVHILKNLVSVTIGNIIGGGLFVGIFFWIAYKYCDKKHNNLNSEKNLAA